MKPLLKLLSLILINATLSFGAFAATFEVGDNVMVPQQDRKWKDKVPGSVWEISGVYNDGTCLWLRTPGIGDSNNPGRSGTENRNCISPDAVVASIPEYKGFRAGDLVLGTTIKSYLPYLLPTRAQWAGGSISYQSGRDVYDPNILGRIDNIFANGWFEINTPMGETKLARREDFRKGPSAKELKVGQTVQVLNCPEKRTLNCTATSWYPAKIEKIEAQRVFVRGGNGTTQDEPMGNVRSSAADPR